MPRTPAQPKYAAKLVASITWAHADNQPVNGIWLALFAEKSGMVIERHEHTMIGDVFGDRTVAELANDDL